MTGSNNGSCCLTQNLTTSVESTSIHYRPNRGNIVTKHHQINTALDAALALDPPVGPFAKYRFDLGLIGGHLGVASQCTLRCSRHYRQAVLSKKPCRTRGSI